MSHALTSSVAGAAAIAVLAGSLTVSGRAAPGQTVGKVTRTIYASVTDKNGAALTDMQAADFEVKDGGKPTEIISVVTPQIPLRIAVLVADQGTGAFQRGTGQFMQKLFGHAEFALYSIVVQPEKI